MKEYRISKKLLSQIAGINHQTFWRKVAELGYRGRDAVTGHHVEAQIARKIISKYIFQRYSPKKRIQTFFNFKGGTGKTTLAYNISYMFFLYGYKVLVIDCDPQGHLTRSICGSTNDKLSYYDVATDQKAMQEVIYKVCEGYHILPSSITLTFFDTLVQNMESKERILQRSLEQIKDEYDFIFIDVNPAINQLNKNCIIASDIVNIVSEAQPYSFFGMEGLLKEFQQLAEISPQHQIEYDIILNKVEPRSIISIEIANTLRDTPGIEGHLVNCIVRKSEDFNLSAKESKPVICLSGKNSLNAKNDIMELAKELLLRSTTVIQENLDENE